MTREAIAPRCCAASVAWYAAARLPVKTEAATMTMAATSQSQPTPPALPRDLPAAHREILGLRQRNARQAEVIAEYREWERWTRQLLALPQGQLAPTAKAVAWTIEDKHRRYRRRHADGEPMPV